LVTAGEGPVEGGRFRCGGLAAERPPTMTVVSITTIRIRTGAFFRIELDSFYPLRIMIAKRSLNPSIRNQPDERYQNIKHVGYPWTVKSQRDPGRIQEQGQLSFGIVTHGGGEFRVFAVQARQAVLQNRVGESRGQQNESIESRRKGRRW